MNVRSKWYTIYISRMTVTSHINTYELHIILLVILQKTDYRHPIYSTISLIKFIEIKSNITYRCWILEYIGSTLIDSQL